MKELEKTGSNSNTQITEPVDSVLDKLLIAAQSGISIDMLTKFMDLAERHRKSEAEKAYNKAFAAFQANIPDISKDKNVDYTTKSGARIKYKHATIGNIVKHATMELSKHGLAHRWLTVQNGKEITCTCILKHVDGHSEQSQMTAGADESGNKNPIQSISSTKKYLMRYTFEDVTGIAVLDTDDDARGSKAGFPKEQPKKDASFFTDKLDAEIKKNKGSEHVIAANFIKRHQKMIDALPAQDKKDVEGYVKDMIADYPGTNEQSFQETKPAMTEEAFSKWISYIRKLANGTTENFTAACAKSIDPLIAKLPKEQADALEDEKSTVKQVLQEEGK